MPTMIAQQIVGVQPMTAATGQMFNLKTGKPLQKFERLNIAEYDEGVPVPEDYCMVEVNLQVSAWIREQPIHLWKDITTSYRDRYVIADDLYTALALRWM